jgi:hypothetical protein
MAIDDHPFDALEKHIKLEQASVSPITKLLLMLCSLVSWMWPFDKAFAFLKDRAGVDSANKTGVMLEACMNEVRSTKPSFKHSAPLYPHLPKKSGRRQPTHWSWMRRKRQSSRDPSNASSASA